ncbi:enoyl-CoA hydratase/isomerase family protein [Sodalis ligni]|uniref:Enoyl-CoA hydratase/carnithine racemase n=1 Tax=Sodalis ligni TaxID=2697027 RepID=A0A4R1NFG9_9GAMM|nr:enoyl-CoA hydratase/isomerase family protein [Sodalis ligni]TCL06272.1 enoyl-CoA hydratase/carnithine racemase [Sodalis ligni]
MASPNGNVELEKRGNIAIVTLNRPEKLNALTPDMLSTLEEIARALDADTDIRAVVLTACGEKAFCVGADINIWSALQPLDMWRTWVRNGHRIFDAWATLRIPVIAAANGHAFGGGLELLATADIRVCEPGATFAFPEAGIATCPGWSGTQRVVKLIGSGMVKYMALTGNRISADKALQIGLIQEISAPGKACNAAIALAEKIATLAPVSVQLTKQLIDASLGINSAAIMEGMAGALAATTADAKEGLASFSERRHPLFKGE